MRRVNALTLQDVQSLPTVIRGTLLVHGFLASVLFDSGASHSFMSVGFASKLSNPVFELSEPFVVSSPGGQLFYSYELLRDVSVLVSDTSFPADLIVLELEDFDVILGMDWLAAHRAVIDCSRRKVVLPSSEDKTIVLRGLKPTLVDHEISALKAWRLINRGEPGVMVYALQESGADG